MLPNVILIKVRLVFNTDDQSQEETSSRSHQTLLTFGCTVNKSSTVVNIQRDDYIYKQNATVVQTVKTLICFKVFSTLGGFYLNRKLFNKGGSSYNLLTINSSVYTISPTETSSR